MSGLVVSTQSIINLIRDNLSDRYHAGYPILKELLQNADDGRASALEFLWHPGLPEACHPLLRGPGLVVVNDGEFRSLDGKAIRNLGLSHRIAEQDKVGKFGLGLKSVFHLCEAFFFAASHCVDDPESGPRFEVVNPWADFENEEYGPFYRQWNSTELGDLERLRAALLSPLLSSLTWFLLWIPLRQAHHRPAGSDLFIDQKVYGDDPGLPAFLQPAALLGELPDTMALLRNLREVSVRSYPPVGPPEQLLAVDLSPDARRSGYGGTLKTGKPSTIEGFIYSQAGSSTTESILFGRELHSAERVFQDLRKHSLWPRQSVLAIRRGDPPAVLDKNEPHAAVYFVRHQSSAQFRFQQACFLPLGELDQHQLPGPHGFGLIVHGFYFIDAGRQRALASGSSGAEISTQEELKAAWNANLEALVALPLLLPTLSDFVQALSLPEEEISQLTRCLARAQWLRERRQNVGREHSWICRLRPDQGFMWELTPAQEPLYVMPLLERVSEGRLRHGFPALGTLAREVHILPENEASLTARDASRAWPEKLLLALLSNLYATVFTDRQCLKTIVELTLRSPPTPAIEERIIQLVRQAFSELLAEHLQPFHEELAQLLDLVGPGRLLPVCVRDPKLFRALSGLSLTCVIRPEWLVPREAGSAQFTLEDGRLLVEFLTDQTLSLDARHETLQLLLENLATPPQEFLSLYASAEIIPILDCRTRKRITTDWFTLSHALGEGRVFAQGSGTVEAKLEDQLGQALAESRIYTIVPRLGKALLGEPGLPGCTPAACFETLARGPELGKLEARLRLVRLLDRPDLGPREIQCLRYLLHGQVGHLGFEGPLWPAGGRWSPLVLACLAQANQSWREVSQQARELSQMTWTRLALEEPGPASFTTLARSVGPETLEFSGVDSHLCSQVLIEVGDLGLLRQLRLHPERKGGLVSITASTYLLDAVNLPEEALDAFPVILPLDDSMLAARQAELCRKLDAPGSLELLLQHPEPSRFTSLILELLPSARATTYQDWVTWHGLKQSLAVAKWMAWSGGASAPEDVLTLEGHDEQLGRLLSRLDSPFVGLAELPAPIQEHEAFQIVFAECFLGNERTLQRVADLLAGSPTVSLGVLSDCPDSDLLLAFEGVPESLLLAWDLVQSVLRASGSRILLDAIVKPVDVQRATGVLDWLQVRCEATTGEEREAVLRIYRNYLRRQVSDALTKALLSNGQLPAQSGRWRSARELCVPIEGVDPDDLLDEEVFSNLQVQLPERSRPGLPAERNSRFPNPAEALSACLAGWQEAGAPKEALGGFLAPFCRSIPKLEGTVRDLLGNLDLDQVLTRMRWRPQVEHQEPNRSAVLRNYRFRISLVSQQTVQLASLTGQPLTARLRQDAASLVVGRIERGFERDEVYFEVCLRRLPADGLSKAKLFELLKESCRQVVTQCFLRGSTSPQFEAQWAQLEEGSQFDIQLARHMMARHAFSYLGSISASARSQRARLGQLYQEWLTQQRRYVQAANVATNTEVEARREAEAELDRLVASVAELLDSDAQTQEVLLKAVRDKIGGHFQYSLHSIAFELFQNADDSVVELEEMEGQPGCDAFLVTELPGRIVFAHWGRPINLFRARGRDFRERGFDRDLEKMLVLHNSDKQSDEVTGKFGLGFKSVFLAASHVEICSGNLAFDIVGGIYPRPLEAQAAGFLRSLAEERSSPVTLVSLQLDEGVEAGRLLQRFRSCLPVLLAFARRLKRCRLNRAGETLAWSAESLLPGISRGHLTVHPGLLVDTTAGSVLLGLDKAGFRKLDKALPKLWVTAPLEESPNIDYALNGPFELDIGRAQLAREASANLAMARELGAGLAERLGQLYAQDDQLPGLLRLDSPRPGHIWASLWQCLTGALCRSSEDSHPGLELAEQLERACWTALLPGRRVVPTELSGLHSGLTTADDVDFGIHGLLDQAAVFKIVSAMTGVKLPEPGRVVSEKVFKILRLLGFALRPACRSLDLSAVVQDTLTQKKGRLAPALADQLATLFQSSFFHAHQSKEAQEIQQTLGRSSVRTAEGGYAALADLLISGEQWEEDLIIPFAPDDRLLALDYGPDASTMLGFLRGPYQPGLRLLADWACAAHSEEAMAGVLAFIARSDRGARLAYHLRASQQGSRLLQALESGGSELDLSDDELDILQDSLRETSAGDSGSETPVPQYRDAGQALRALAAWWRQAGPEQIRRYETELYPGGAPPRLTEGPGSVSERESWLVLFLLGAFHSQGRTRDFQHRGFLELCQREGWLQQMADPSTPPQFWAEMLESYLERYADSPQPYLQWMRQLPVAFQLARYLEQYVQGFLAPGRSGWPSRFHPRQILSLNSSPVFQGTGLSAPSLERALGFGVCFVLRELVRLGLIREPRIHPYCFVPSRSVLEVLSALGGPALSREDVDLSYQLSAEIHQAIVPYLGDDCHFGFSFDLPLRALARDSGLQQRLLGESLELDLSLADEDVPAELEGQARAIFASCQRRGIRHLFHFARLDHLESIFQEGLLQRHHLSDGVKATDALRLDGHPEAICLSIGFPNDRMFSSYRIQDPESKWAVLRLSADVLWELPCAFYPTNAASGAMKRQPVERMSTGAAFDELFSGPTAAYPRDSQAEVLVFGPIPAARIEEAFLRGNPGTRWRGLPVRCEPSYFGPRPESMGG